MPVVGMWVWIKGAGVSGNLEGRGFLPTVKKDNLTAAVTRAGRVRAPGLVTGTLAEEWLGRPRGSRDQKTGRRTGSGRMREDL